MEQGPDEIDDRPDERAEDLERLTDRPLGESDDEEPSDDRAGAASSPEGDGDLEAIDPGL